MLHFAYQYLVFVNAFSGSKTHSVLFCIYFLWLDSDCDTGAGSNPPISLPLTVNLPLPSTIQPPSLELKPLPEHLKYAYLDYAQKLSIIISSSLSLEHEDKLLQVLKGHKKAIRWTLADLLGINPSI